MPSRPKYGWTKQQVLNWFGDRGVPIQKHELKQWYWEDGKLYFVVDPDNEMEIVPTEPGEVGVTHTHDAEGNPILVYELYDSIPLEESPLGQNRSR